MEPGKSSFRALVLVFGSESENLTHFIEDKIFQLLDYRTNIDPDKQWVWLEDEGLPEITVCWAEDTINSRDAYEGYDYYFLAGELDSGEVAGIRKMIRECFLEKEFYMTFLLPSSEHRLEQIFENECLITQPDHFFLSEQALVNFIHDFCAFEILPNLVSVDLAEYAGQIRGKIANLECFDYYPKQLDRELSCKTMPNFLFLLIFVDNKYNNLETISGLIKPLTKYEDLDYSVTDVTCIGLKRIVCLYTDKVRV